MLGKQVWLYETLTKLRFIVPAAEYAKADLRWMRSDTSIVALELGTVLVETTLAYFVVRGVVYNTVYRQFVQTCASVLQVYRGAYVGVWYENLSGVVSCPENSNINTDGLDSVVIGSR